MIGDFPPPVHGKSLANAAIRERIIRLGAYPIIINLSPPSLNRRWFTRLLRIRRVFSGVIIFANTIFWNENGSIYISISGGYGQIYELIFIFIGRLLGRRLFLYHQSYAYLNRPMWTTHILTWLAGKKAIHIVLCPDMGKKLSLSYKSVGQIKFISNAAIIQRYGDEAPRVRSFLRTVGFLGNISYEKGFIEFLDVIAQLAMEGVTIRALIAGPFQNNHIEGVFRQRLSHLRTAEYVGPKYGVEKTLFYDTIDVLLFPTKYKNEAEPLTVHEAMARAVPVIARQRGCIATIIPPDGGLVVDDNVDFVRAAVKQLLVWHSSPSDFHKISRKALDSFLSVRKEYTGKVEELCSELIYLQ